MIKNIMNNIGKRPSTDVAYLKGSEDPQLKADVKKAISTHHATGNNLLNVLYNKDKELYKKLDAMGTTNAEQFINQLAYGEEETREDILPSKISTDDFSYKQLEDYASGLEEALKTQKDKFTDETRASTEKELEAVKKVLLKRQAEKKPE